MKKAQSKRSGPGTSRGQDLKKPFDFCCDVKNQDPETRYDKKDPPFKSSMSNIFLNGGGPDLKFRVQDVGRLPHPVRVERRRIVRHDSLGDCRRCRGPLRWYIEDEISLAKDIQAHDKQEKYKLETKRNLSIAVEKVKKRRERKREEKRKK